MQGPGVPELRRHLQQPRQPAVRVCQHALQEVHGPGIRRQTRREPAARRHVLHPGHGIRVRAALAPRHQVSRATCPVPRVTCADVPSAAMEANPPSNLTESDRSTHFVMQWGQFVDHDILSTAGNFFDCCHPDIK